MSTQNTKKKAEHSLISENLQKKNFVEIESYKHKSAKQTFKEWSTSAEWSEDIYTNSVDTNFSYENGETVKLRWNPNRSEGAFLEYPITSKYDIEGLWDETGVCGWYDCSTPTYDECIKMGAVPISIIDIVLPHKGMPQYFIEICHKNPVSDSKIEKLEALGIRNLIEIDADWILNQTSVPRELKIKRWLL